MKKLLAISCFLFVVLFAGSVSALIITDLNGFTAAQMAQEMLGSGVTISNVSFTGTTGGPGNASAGSFTGGTAAGIGIESGIVLTSGFASHLNGTSNTSDDITGDNGLPGDADLDALIPGYFTLDATILEFDFESVGDAAYFNYVFGSEEYNEYVDSEYNDVFGFFFMGNNIATIPGTTLSVAINNVNNGSYSGYYNDNDPTDLSPVPYPFEYDGFTDVFTAEITGINPGTEYHLKLAIADAGDHILDSGVFIQAGSFSDEPVDPTTIPEPGTLLLLSAGLSGLVGYSKLRLRRRNRA